MTARVTLRVTSEELEQWRQRAVQQGRPLSQWIRHELRRASAPDKQLGLFEPRPKPKKKAKAARRG